MDKYSLNEEIKMHVYLWLNDARLKNLSPTIKNRLIEISNDIKVSDALIKFGGTTQSGGDPINNERKIFIAMFREKFMEYTDFKYTEEITPINGNQIGRVCRRLLDEGSSAREFLEWFFDDFASLEANKKYMPPTVGFVVQTWIVDKFIYVFKDALKMRKKNSDETQAKNFLMQIAIEHIEQFPDKKAGETLLAFSRNELSLSRFRDALRRFALKVDDKKTLEKIDKLLKK